MHSIKWLLKISIGVALFAALSACFKSEQTPAAAGAQSAMAVKDNAQTLSLKPLNAALNSASSVSKSSKDLSVKSLRVNDVFLAKKSHVFVEDSGKVVKILADDNKGARHQKFLVRIETGQTLLFAHNIDLAPRVENIQVDDTVTFRGEYVYNPKGGVIHWTHKDPKNQRSGGWVQHQGQQYE